MMKDYQVTVTTAVTRTYKVRTFSEESVRAMDWSLWDDVVEVEMKNKPDGEMHKEFNVEFTPTEWRYYYDCVRFHCRDGMVSPAPIFMIQRSLNFIREMIFPKVSDGVCGEGQRNQQPPYVLVDFSHTLVLVIL